MNPLIFVAAGLLLSGCSLFGNEKPKTAPPRNPDDSPACGPEEERLPDAGRVKMFEGLSLDDFKKSLAERPEKEAVLKELKSIMSGGDPKRIDPGLETIQVAQLFHCKSGSFRHLMPFPFRLSGEDANHYSILASRNIWDKKRKEITKEYNLDKVRHPFAQWTDEIPVENIHNLRGLPAFDALADILVAKIPEVKIRRDLNVLYPGSGSHLAPLMIAIKLIDQGKIDQAHFTYTEINASRSGTFITNLRTAVFKRVFDKLSLEKWVDYPENGGSERTIEVSYKGHPIRIVYAIQRSGDRYYRDEYFKAADLVILHDPGIGYLSQSYDLLADLLLKRKSLGLSQNQMLIMEGGRRPEFHYDEKLTFPAGMVQTLVPGPYGHCDGVEGVGEVSRCHYESARAFLLNDPDLQARATQYAEPYQLSGALYQDLEPKVSVLK